MKNKKVVIIISIITIISFIIGFSYAYFTTIVIGNDTASSNITTSGSLKLNFNGLDYIDMQNSQPGDTDSMTFTVTNSGTLQINNYEIYFSNLVNSFINDEVVYEISCVSSDAVSCTGINETPLPNSEELILTQGSIAPGTTHTYSIDVTFIETGFSQNYNQEKILLFTISVNEMQVNPNYLTIGNGEYYSYTGFFWDYREEITSITFEDQINIPVGAYDSWDVSEYQDGSIMAHIMDDGLGMDTFELIIQSDDTIYANPNSSYYFYSFEILENINNLIILDTSNVTNMSYMFGDNQILFSLDISAFNTTNVINMSGMFSNTGLTSLDLSNFDTSNVTNMSWMFQGSDSLTAIDISSFITTNLITMSYMFYGCDNITSFDLSSFDTSSVTSMYRTFFGCEALLTLDLSNFDTSNVTTMNNMFFYCSSLTTLDVSSFNTSIVTNMSTMFGYCSSLVSLDLSGFDTSSVTNMSYMFQGCTGLTSLNLRNANFATVTSYTSMLSNITSGITITVKDSTAQTWITSRLTDAGKTGNVTIYVP